MWSRGATRRIHWRLGLKSVTHVVCLVLVVSVHHCNHSDPEECNTSRKMLFKIPLVKRSSLRAVSGIQVVIHFFHQSAPSRGSITGLRFAIPIAVKKLKKNCILYSGAVTSESLQRDTFLFFHYLRPWHWVKTSLNWRFGTMPKHQEAASTAVDMSIKAHFSNIKLLVPEFGDDITSVIGY